VVENPQRGALQPGRRHHNRTGGLANHSDPLECKRFIPPASGQALATALPYTYFGADFDADSSKEATGNEMQEDGKP
jgi:hypothetical protein